MKTILTNALMHSKPEFENPWFCRITLHRGYDNFYRDIIFHELKKEYPGRFDVEIPFEKKRIDIAEFEHVKSIYDKKIKTIIQVSHEGTWQSVRENIDHAIKDIEYTIYNFSGSKEILESREIYTITMITDVQQIDEKEIFRISKTYREGIKSNINNHYSKIEEIKELFKRLDFNNIHLLFTSEWNNFVTDTNIFICGPFHRIVPDREKIYNI